MRPDTCVDIVSRFYAVTGKRLPDKQREADAVFAVWEEAIGDLPDDELALAATVEMIRTTDFRYGLPSPVLFREAYIELSRRRPPPQRELMEENNPVLATAEFSNAALRQAIDNLFRVPRGAAPHRQPERPLAHVRAGAHEFGDHDLCGPDCIDRRAVEEQPVG